MSVSSIASIQSFRVNTVIVKFLMLQHKITDKTLVNRCIEIIDNFLVVAICIKLEDTELNRCRKLNFVILIDHLFCDVSKEGNDCFLVINHVTRDEEETVLR